MKTDFGFVAGGYCHCKRVASAVCNKKAEAGFTEAGPIVFTYMELEGTAVTIWFGLLPSTTQCNMRETRQIKFQIETS